MSANAENPLSYRGKTFVRTVGTLLISGCCLMVVLGVSVLKFWLANWPRFILYWSWCFLIAMLAMLVALFDMVMIRRAGRETQRKLYQQQFKR